MHLFQFRRYALALTTLGGILGAAGMATAGGTNAVSPATAHVGGYSLADIAKATAVYNTGIFAGNPATPEAPDVPFYIVEGDATVGTGTNLYLPIFFADDSAPADPAFPASVDNQKVDASYLDNLIFNAFDVSAFVVEVDGVITTLSDSYITGVDTAPLLDGVPAGTHYISVAAFIKPLTPGVHTVGFGGVINGSPVIFGESQITVVPGHN